MSFVLEPGRIIAERYHLDHHLGRGGMGTVWAATHLVTRRPIALKFLTGTDTQPERVRQRFIQEARAASAVRHPNVVQIYDVIDLPHGWPVMVMELLEGETLQERLDRVGVLRPSEFSRILGRTVAAVAAAHTMGVIHRDLKPDNVFLAKTLGERHVTVKVLDFGIAKITRADSDVAAALTGTGTLLGTPHYMSPEQAFGEKNVDTRSDIWALGVMAYRALSGVLPTDGENLGQVFKIIITGAIPPLLEAAPEVAPEIAEMVDSMLQVSRERRPANLQDVRMVFDMHGAGSRVRPVSREPQHSSVPSEAEERVRPRIPPPGKKETQSAEAICVQTLSELSGKLASVLAQAVRSDLDSNAPVYGGPGRLALQELSDKVSGMLSSLQAVRQETEESLDDVSQLALGEISAHIDDVLEAIVGDQPDGEHQFDEGVNALEDMSSQLSDVLGQLFDEDERPDEVEQTPVGEAGDGYDLAAKPRHSVEEAAEEVPEDAVEDAVEEAVRDEASEDQTGFRREKVRKIFSAALEQLRDGDTPGELSPGAVEAIGVRLFDTLSEMNAWALTPHPDSGQLALDDISNMVAEAIEDIRQEASGDQFGALSQVAVDQFAGTLSETLIGAFTLRVGSDGVSVQVADPIAEGAIDDITEAAGGSELGPPCGACGEFINLGAHFCGHCGAVQASQSPDLQQDGTEPAAGNERGESHIEAARRLARLGRLEEAALRYGLANMPWEAGSHYLSSGNTERGLMWLARVHDSSPNFRKAGQKVVRLLTEHNMFDPDLEPFLRGWVATGPTDASEGELFWLLSELYEREGRLPGAIEAIHRVLVKDPDFAEAAVRLSQLKMRMVAPRARGAGARKRVNRSAQTVNADPVDRPGVAKSSLRSSSLMNELKTTRTVPFPFQRTEEAFAIGTIVAGRYRLEEQLGRGGMSIVFRVTDLDLEEEIALKVFIDSIADEASRDENARRFRQELKLNRKLRHPNVVRLYDMGVHCDHRYLTMEILSGCPLDELLGDALELGFSLGILSEACRGLHATHQQSVIHRDIKSENLFVCDDDTLKIMDFGIAKSTVGMGVTVVVKWGGTPSYMAPEQVDNFSDVTPAADQYSLGVVAYEVLSGQLPFRQTQLVPLLMAHANQPPTPLCEFVPELPPQLDALVLRMLAKTPEDRYPNLGVVADELDAVAQKIHRSA